MQTGFSCWCGADQKAMLQEHRTLKVNSKGPRYVENKKRSIPKRNTATRSDIYTLFLVGRDSVVGIATRYGLGGPGIESRWGRDFPQPSRPALGPIQPPIQ